MIVSMELLSLDTPPDVERVWLQIQRQRGPAWRLRRAIDMTVFCRMAAREAVRRALPGASRQEQDLRLLTELYGTELAHGFVARRAELGFYDRAL